MSDLKERLIRLGSDNPDLRKYLRPILAEIERRAERAAEMADLFAGGRYIVGPTRKIADALERGQIRKAIEICKAGEKDWLSLVVLFGDYPFSKEKTIEKMNRSPYIVGKPYDWVRKYVGDDVQDRNPAKRIAQEAKESWRSLAFLLSQDEELTPQLIDALVSELRKKR